MSFISFDGLADTLFKLYEKSKMAVFITLLLIWIFTSSSYMPNALIEWTGLADIIFQNNIKLRIVFLIASGILFFVVFIYVSSGFEKKRNDKKRRIYIQHTVQALNKGECRILMEFLLKQQDMIYLPYDNEFVKSLAYKGVIIGDGELNLGTMLFTITNDFRPHITQKIFFRKYD